MRTLLNVFFHWLPLGVGIFFVSAASFAAVHQNYRQGFNDPQIQIAEDAVTLLEAGKTPAEVVGRAPIFDAEKSLAPFVAVYDKNGNPLESSASIGSNPPKPPIGVFQFSQKYGGDKVTWQPNPETRIALVVRPVLNSSGYFVASGRNMREVERKENLLTWTFFMGTLAALVGSFAFDIIGDFYRRKISAKIGR